MPILMPNNKKSMLSKSSKRKRQMPQLPRPRLMPLHVRPSSKSRPELPKRRGLRPRLPKLLLKRRSKSVSRLN